MGDAAIGFVLAYVLTALFAPLIFSAIGVKADTPADQLPLRAVALEQIPFYAGMLGAVVYAALRKGNGLRRDFHLGARLRDLVGLPIGLGTQYAALILYIPILYFTNYTAEDVSKPARDLTNRANSPASVVALVLVVVIAAPIVEELFFRGLLLRSIERRFGTGWAIAGSSVVFAAAHFEPLQFPALLLFGVVAALLAVRTDRLGAGMCAHFAFNLIAVVQLLH